MMWARTEGDRLRIGESSRWRDTRTLLHRGSHWRGQDGCGVEGSGRAVRSDGAIKRDRDAVQRAEPGTANAAFRDGGSGRVLINVTPIEFTTVPERHASGIANVERAGVRRRASLPQGPQPSRYAARRRARTHTVWRDPLPTLRREAHQGTRRSRSRCGRAGGHAGSAPRPPKTREQFVDVGGPGSEPVSSQVTISCHADIAPALHGQAATKQKRHLRASQSSRTSRATARRSITSAVSRTGVAFRSSQLRQTQNIIGGPHLLLPQRFDLRAAFTPVRTHSRIDSRSVISSIIANGSSQLRRRSRA